MKFLITLGLPFLLHVITHKSLSFSLPRISSNIYDEYTFNKGGSFWPSTFKLNNKNSEFQPLHEYEEYSYDEPKMPDFSEYSYNMESNNFDNENEKNENLGESFDLLSEALNENEEPFFEDYAAEGLDNNSDDHSTNEENNENENLEEPSKLLSEESNENEEPIFEENDLEGLDNNSENHSTNEENYENEKLEEPLDNNQIADDDSLEDRGIFFYLANFNIALAVKRVFYEIVDGTVKELYEKASESTEDASEAHDTPTSENSEEYSRRKRSLGDFIGDSLTHATTDLASLVKKPFKQVSQQSTSNNEISLPQLSDNTPNPLGNLMAMPELIEEFLIATKRVFKEISHSANEIKNAANGLLQATKTDSITAKLYAAREAQQIIQKEVKKAQYAFNVVNETLHQIGIASQTDEGQFTSSECLQTFADIPGLLNVGKICLVDKLNEGHAIINSTMENLAVAASVPGDVSDEITKCNNKENNIMGQFICYTTIPLMLKEDEILLPIEFVKRITETSQYFATLREDLIICGIRTLVSIAEKGEKCAAELIVFYRDLALRSANATEAYNADTQSRLSPLNVLSSTMSNFLGH
uniref:Putative 56.6 kDa salivary protein n=1 Tax=Nyssomyia neivai TaxID=330878 RepID=A0A1L8DR76_9DIPT